MLWRGRLIALEGPKGVGKTTLATVMRKRLNGSPGSPGDAAHRFQSPATMVMVTKEPTPAFDLGNEAALNGLALAEAIAADRRHHIAEEIGPALEAGALVICDRYILSSYAFHCAADGVPAEVIDELNRDFPPPALNLILRAAPDEIARRRGERGTTTRLQGGDESDAYLAYARRMQTRGVPFQVVDNATMTDLDHLADQLCAICAAFTGTAS